MSDPITRLPDLAGGAGINDGALGALLKQLTTKKTIPVASGGGIAVAAPATVNLSDGTNNTLSITARLPGQHGNSIFYKTARRTGSGGELLFDLTIYYPNNTTVVETWASLSMAAASPRYAPTVLAGGQVGGAGAASEWVVLADLGAAEADDRPVDGGPTALTGGTNEFALTGVKRGDYIAGCIDITTAAAPVAIDVTKLYCVDTGKIAALTGGTVAASHGLIFEIWPKP
jgi:hypothetical protein